MTTADQALDDVNDIIINDLRSSENGSLDLQKFTQVDYDSFAYKPIYRHTGTLF